MPQTQPAFPVFDAGFGAAILVDHRDETRLNHKITLNDMREILKRTTFQSPDASEELSYGLLSGLVKPEGYLSQDHTTVAAQMATFIGKNRNKHFLLIAPSGFKLGYEAVFCETKASDFDVDVTASGVTTAAAGFATTESGILDGQVLHSPHGDSSGGPAVINLIFDGTNALQFLALRCEGTAPIFEFRLTDYANSTALRAAIKAGIEALPAYAGRTVVVTGSLTGTDNRSGILTVTFDAKGSVSTLETISGAVRGFNVLAGDNGNYRWNGGANFALGITEGNLQTNQRALGGQHSAVVVKGSSSFPTGTINNDGAPFASSDGNGGPPEARGVGAFGDNQWNYTAWAPTSETSNSGNAFVGWGRTAGREIAVDHYTVKFREAIYNSPGLGLFQSWVIEASNDFNSWVLLDTRTNIVTADNGSYDFAFANTTAYRYYRLRVLGGTANLPSLDELMLYPSATSGLGSYVSYYPVTSTPPAPTATGTGATTTVINAAGAAANTVSPLTLSTGGSSGLSYNFITASGNGSWVDGEITTAKFNAILSVLKIVGTGASITIRIEHADDQAGAPNAATIADALVFNAATASGVQMRRAVASQLKRWRRVRWTIAGTTPIAVFAVAAAS
jgi:hypothetical protein